MHEVDMVPEGDDGMIVDIDIEMKGSATVRSNDFAGLRTLSRACGERFSFGVVLCDNTVVVHFGERLVAVPISSLRLPN